MKPFVLSIGTTHPANVAGVGRDLVVGTELQCGVLTAVAAVSVQDERRLSALHVVPAGVLRAQLEALGSHEVHAFRIGALGSRANVEVVVERLASSPALAVVDPVRRASTGEPLVDDDGWEALRASLSTLPTVVLTPNVEEAAALLRRPLVRRNEMESAARELRARGAAAVLLKGGDLDGEPADVLATGDGVETFAASRLSVRMRGTGCTLAMALACELAAGSGMRDSVVSARAYVRAKMEELARE